MEAIRTEHDLQNRTIQGQKTALDTIVSDLSSLRLLGKDRDTSSHMASPAMTPAVDSNMDIVEGNAENGVDGLNGLADLTATDNGVAETGEIDEKEDREEDKASSDDIPLSSLLNPTAKPFCPPSASTKGRSVEEDDIEMGEVAEDPKDNLKGKRKIREELEEGEASDSSSALSEPPDD